MSPQLAYYYRNKEQRIAYHKLYVKKNGMKMKAYYRLRYRNNRDKIRAQRKARYVKNIEKHRAYDRARYTNRKPPDPITKRAYARAHYGRNKDKCKAAQKAWTKDNPEWMRAYYAKKRARKHKAPGQFTPADLHAQLIEQNGRCYWCCIYMKKPTIDHVIPLSRGGSNFPDNIVLACLSCNCSKHNKLPLDWVCLLIAG